MLKMAFSKHGFPLAFVAYDGIAAVELFKKAEKKPNVILMDYDLLIIRLNGILWSGRNRHQFQYWFK